MVLKESYKHLANKAFTFSTISQEYNRILDFKPSYSFGFFKKRTHWFYVLQIIE